MKKSGIVLLVAAAALSLLWVACKESEPSPTVAPSEGKTGSTVEEASPTAKATEPSDGAVSGGGDFHGIPVPKGAKQAQALSWQFPGGPQEGEYGKVEWRGYEAEQSAEKIIAFYKDEMPKRGWEQSFWMEGMGDMAWGIYFRDNEEQAAWIYVMSGSEDFDLLLMWAGEKK